MKRIPTSIIVFLTTIAPAIAAETTERTESLPDADPACMHASQWSGLHTRESSRAAADSSSAGRGRRTHSCAADHYRAGRPHRHYAGAAGTTLDHHLAPTLSGNAKSKAEADKAVKIARDTKGVSSVKNEIKVQAK